VNSQGTSLPKGQVGEVVISGENVFGGYLDNAEADREALRDGWFHTGDLGFLDEDGYLFLTGRKKELINRAGEKVAPREVEEVLHRLPEVETAGVVGVPHQIYGEEIVAFITLRNNQKLEAEEVRQFCREHLADFKVPREVFFIEELPKGPSGKVQRRRLRDVYHHLTAQSKEEKPS
jgi:acyl-CoA synthetase (AMP-forming)/AMP-acid ligase II